MMSDVSVNVGTLKIVFVEKFVRNNGLTSPSLIIVPVTLRFPFALWLFPFPVPTYSSASFALVLITQFLFTVSKIHPQLIVRNTTALLVKLFSYLICCWPFGRVKLFRCSTEFGECGEMSVDILKYHRVQVTMLLSKIHRYRSMTDPIGSLPWFK
jgi:hypothetical protein